MSYSGVALAIVAKLPRIGTCKTRLVPPLTYESAAELSAALLRDTADNVAQVSARGGAMPVALYHGDAAPGELDRIFAPGFTYLQQRGSDFGDRLANGAADLFALGFEGVCLIDSDSPTMPPAALAQAVDVLGGSCAPVVLGAAVDGGYYLLGMRRFYATLFEGIAWSTDAVARQTRARAFRARLNLIELVPWYDIDDGAALTALADEFARGLPSGGFHAPATRATLARVMRSALPEATACAPS